MVCRLSATYSRYFLVALALIFIACCKTEASAESRVFSGVSSDIILHKDCTDKPKNTDIVLVFDGEPDATSSGMFYGKGTMTAEFKRISPTHYAVTYVSSKFSKMPDSHMDLLPFEDGYRAIIKDHIPEDKELLAWTCFYVKFEVILKPTKDSAEVIKSKVRELFTAELISQDADYLLYEKKDYLGAITKGKESLEIAERIYGKNSKEALNYSAVIIFSLMRLDRYDEALNIVAQFLRVFPDNTDLKELEALIQLDSMNKNDLSKAELLYIEADNLFYSKKEYWEAIAKAKESLEITERIYGKASKETVEPSFIIVLSLFALHRYDEALAILEPYRMKYPDVTDIKEIEEKIQMLLKEQNELFNYDQKNGNDIAFDTLG